ncbi:aldehyde dehydrogenase [Microbacterium sp. No. 7]|uniref:aldehyde dehydrogenase n=1 Tax=Microbacterium sp. No. 7 TaxID=1714373 RepID=UPI0006CFDB7B|nr:aldehyde dehydrogenase [Microbacterium sp. No. 7]ALJ19235.1 aldehyde dehydrogenase [Microbacterium sp. No. 7]
MTNTINLDPTHLVIGGEARPAHSTARIPLVNPATEEQFGSAVDGDAQDVDAAVRAAQEAAPAWAALTPVERAGHLLRLADELEARAEDIAQLLTKENGLPISIARGHLAATPREYRYFASLAERIVPEEHIETANGDALIRRVPVGVTAIVVAWNGPQPLVARKLGPALVAGCTVVIKPAAETSLDAYPLMEAIEAAGIPAGVVNLVTGGRETGAALVAHPGVRKIAFTGSTRAGAAIGEEGARQFKRVTLELGGKSAGILLDDVDLETFRPWIFGACLPQSGQVCRSLTRILAPASRYDEIVSFVADTLSSATVGDPTEPTTVFGPIVNASQHERVTSYIRLGVEEGAKLVIGGPDRPEGLDRGYYVAPTVFRDVTNDMRIAREEIFGPVLTVMPYETVEEAIAIANDSEYGLAGGVFSPDRERATEVARRIEAGSIGVNTAAMPVEAPFGGFKNSGIGRELGPHSVDPYLEYQTVYRAP